MRAVDLNGHIKGCRLNTIKVSQQQFCKYKRHYKHGRQSNNLR